MKSAKEYLEEGNTLYSQGKYNEAILIYDNAIALDPKNQSAYYKKALALKNSSKLDEALSVINKSLEIKFTPEAFIVKGNIYQSLNKWTEALQAYDSALSANPKSGLALYNKAVSLRSLRRFDEALSVIDKAIESGYKEADAYLLKGNLLRDTNQNEEALKLYDSALILNPKSYLLFYNKGITYKNLKKYSEAIKALDEAIIISPKSEDPYIAKGIIQKEQNNHEEAIKFYDKAILLNSKNAIGYYNKAIALKCLSKLNEALTAVNKSIEIKSNYPESQILKGNILLELNREDEAIECYNKVLELDPKNARAFFNKSKCLRRKNDSGTALSLILKAIEYDPNSADYLIVLANIYSDQEKYTEAIETYDKAILLNADNPLYYCNRGVVKTKINQSGNSDFRLAKKLLEQGKTSELSEENVNYIKETLEKLLKLEADFENAETEIAKINKQDAKTQGVVNKFKDALEKKKTLKVEFELKKTDDDPLTKLLNEMAELRKELEQLKSKASILENNVDDLNKFKAKFSESTLKFEERKKDSETLIKYDKKMADYYKGFINEFSIAFTAAQAITSGFISFQAEKNTFVTIFSKALSFIPIFGDKISAGVDFVTGYCSKVELENRCRNISKFGMNSSGFDSIAAFVAGGIILDEGARDTISKYTEADTHKWSNVIAKIFAKVGELQKDINDHIMKDYSRMASVQEKMGHQHAQKMIAELISNGEIFEYKDDLQIEKLASKSLALVVSTKTESINPDIKESEPEKKEKKKKPCCQIF